MEFKLIIGLGNNDPAYEKTYHNVGFLFVDYLNAESNPSTPLGEYKSLVSAIKTAGYMNESGLEVKKLIKKYKIDPKDLLIVQDDSDIFIGDYKFSFGRGSAGHKGIQNIIDQLKTEDFWRLRIGIRPKPKTSETLRTKADLSAIAPRTKADLSAIAPRTKADLSAIAPRAKAEEFVLKTISATNLKILHEVFEKSTMEIAKI